MKEENIQGEVVFSSVSVSEPRKHDKLLLCGLHVIVKPKETLALVCRKQHQVHAVQALMERFCSPRTGVVLLDGQNLTALNVHWLRQQMVIVSEDAIFPAYTFEENITYGLEFYMTYEVHVAALLARIHDFIISFKKNYDTRLSEVIPKLTSSLRMRLAIARALIRNPPIVFIEEPDHTDEELEEALDECMRDRTCIVVARKLSTVFSAHKIVITHNGRVLEQGSRAELWQRGGLYYRLMSPTHGQYFP